MAFLMLAVGTLLLQLAMPDLESWRRVALFAGIWCVASAVLEVSE